MRTGDTVVGEIEIISAGAAITVTLMLEETSPLTERVAVTVPVDVNLEVLQVIVVLLDEMIEHTELSENVIERVLYESFSTGKFYPVIVKTLSPSTLSPVLGDTFEITSDFV